MTSNFVKLATRSDIPDGEVRTFEAQGTSIAVCNVGGQFYAIGNLCTHDNGPLGQGQLVDDQVECPRHGARFDVKTGKALCLPAVTPVPTYSVEIRGEEIWVSPTSATSPAKV
jgi:3-phenylpropionate/trans-cinnamate dioxygenase ferredoxin subunit